MSRPSSTVEAIGFSTSTWMPARDAGERDLVMQMGRRRDRDGVDALGEQLPRASPKVGQLASSVARARCAGQRIDHADELDAGQTGEHAGMIAAHHADADHTDTKRALRLGVSARSGPLGTHLIDPNRGTPVLSSTAPHMRRLPDRALRTRFASKTLHPLVAQFAQSGRGCVRKVQPPNPVSRKQKELGAD